MKPGDVVVTSSLTHVLCFIISVHLLIALLLLFFFLLLLFFCFLSLLVAFVGFVLESFPFLFRLIRWEAYECDHYDCYEDEATEDDNEVVYQMELVVHQSHTLNYAVHGCTPLHSSVLMMSNFFFLRRLCKDDLVLVSSLYLGRLISFQFHRVSSLELLISLRLRLGKDGLFDVSIHNLLRLICLQRHRVNDYLLLVSVGLRKNSLLQVSIYKFLWLICLQLHRVNDYLLLISISLRKDSLLHVSIHRLLWLIST